MPENNEEGTQKFGRYNDIREAFLNAGFEGHMEVDLFEMMMGRARLGNMEFVSCFFSRIH